MDHGCDVGENWFGPGVNILTTDAATADDQDLSKLLLEAFEREDIVKGGRLMPERLLATRLGVGRRALRQALARLEGDGLIWRRQGQGTFLAAVHSPHTDSIVRTASSASPGEMMEVRIELEPVLARLCTIHASPDQIAVIRKAAAEAAKADSAHAFERTDLAFHRTVAEGTNNVLLLSMFDLAMTVLRQADWRVARQSQFSHSRLSEVSHQHSDIVEAIAARDPNLAESSMRLHLRSVYDYLNRR